MIALLLALWGPVPNKPVTPAPPHYAQNAPAQLPVYTIATLPKCVAATKGQMVYVSDTTAAGPATFLGSVTGGGKTTVNAPASCNGSGWQYD